MGAPKLQSYVDHSVLVKLAYRDSAVRATLCAVDAHGIWIEAQELAHELLGAKRPQDGVTPILFIPFAHLQYMIGALDTAAVAGPDEASRAA